MNQKFRKYSDKLNAMRVISSIKLTIMAASTRVRTACAIP